MRWFLGKVRLTKDKFRLLTPPTERLQPKKRMSIRQQMRVHTHMQGWRRRPAAESDCYDRWKQKRLEFFGRVVVIPSPQIRARRDPFTWCIVSSNQINVTCCPKSCSQEVSNFWRRRLEGSWTRWKPVFGSHPAWKPTDWHPKTLSFEDWVIIANWIDGHLELARERAWQLHKKHTDAKAFLSDLWNIPPTTDHWGLRKGYRISALGRPRVHHWHGSVTSHAKQKLSNTWWEERHEVNPDNELLGDRMGPIVIKWRSRGEEACLFHVHILQNWVHTSSRHDDTSTRDDCFTTVSLCSRLTGRSLTLARLHCSTAYHMRHCWTSVNSWRTTTSLKRRVKQCHIWKYKKGRLWRFLPA